MTRPRKELVDIADTRYYHIVSRCVRRSFLCGKDESTGRSYEHRRQWIEDRIHLLSSLFGIDICAYAVMSNHLHLVVKLSPEEIAALEDYDVVTRWRYLFKGPHLVQQWYKGARLSDTELDEVKSAIAVLRNRLSNLGWFMKCLNEPIAKRANEEDQCSGHFWESRYKSQALLSENALLAAMAYVDLNPVRAGIAVSPQTSDHTSLKLRLSANKKAEIKHKPSSKNITKRSEKFDYKPLFSFKRSASELRESQLPITFHEYLQLIEFALRKYKNQPEVGQLHHILEVPNQINAATWITDSTEFESIYRRRFSTKLKKAQCAA
ncbi:transposase [Teredinibacter turnerae]|uniref:transposase n=1 Tax=Teredinibacter turnerae TaxID=2426 RepID=UPI0003A15058|nr:transposase [Teredinibacter turnerae]